MSVNIVRKALASGLVSFHVRHVRAGQPVEVLGTFRSTDATPASERKARKAAETLRDRALALAAEGNLTRAALDPNRSDSLADVYVQWAASRHDVDPKTASNYDTTSRKLGALARMPVRTIQPADVRAWLTAQVAEGLSAGTIDNRMQHLRMALDFADLEPNPARHRSVRVPVQGRRALRLPRWADLMAVRALLPDDDDRALFDVMLGGGARGIECQRLTWRQVDHVRQALVGIEGKRNGRTGQVPLRTVPVLRRAQWNWLPERPAGARDQDHVFQAVHVDQRFPKHLAAAQAQHFGLADDADPILTPHKLRHWHATWLDNASRSQVPDVPVGTSACAERMGHDAGMFLRTYNHASFDAADVPRMMEGPHAQAA